MSSIHSKSTLTNASRTNSTITAPSPISDNDVLVAILCVGAASSPAVTPPAGWTEITPTGWPMTFSKADPWEVKVHLYWHLASSESGNYTFSHSAANTEAIMYAVSGANTTTPFSPNPTGATGTGLTSTATGLTTPNNNSLVIFCAADWDGYGAGGTSPPSGTTPTFTEDYDGTNVGVFYAASGVLATAGATGNESISNSNIAGNPWSAGLISVQTGAGTGPTVTAFTIPATTFGQIITISSFTATDDVGVTGYLVNESASTPSATAIGWLASAPSTYKTSNWGSVTLYAWAKDVDGNVSSSMSASTILTSASGAWLHI